MSRTLFFRLIGVLTLWVGQAAWSAPDGRALYLEHCSSCHQTEGRGGIGLPLSKSKLGQVSDAYLAKTIRHGRPGRIMPAFDFMSDAQVEALVDYLREYSGHPGQHFSLASVSGDLERGKMLFNKNCARCHAKDGSGEGFGTGVTLSRERTFAVMPPAINNPGFLASASDEMIKYTILSGRENSDMPSFRDANFSEKDLNSLVAYVRTLVEKSPHAHPIADSEQPLADPSVIFESDYDFDTTVANVRQALNGSNFRLFAERYLEQGLVDEFSVNKKQIGIRFCNFSKLYNMINVEPRLGVVLPCRITIVEREDGQVLLIAPNMSAIARWFNNDELQALSVSMQQIILDVIEEATL